MDAHDTHCCIEHGCKYGEEDCPVANGIRKQQYLCEMCGLETEGYYGPPKRTEAEQQELIDGIWEEKQRPRQLSPDEEVVAALTRKYGRRNLLAMIGEVGDIVDAGKLDLSGITQILLTLKHLP